ncbi:MAG: hypothetical protein A2231_08530 [Candidatus Firestonebacteria bacterium RIFOXYA2_FULL_40_8]|nr:MAG: hypothetical protein A2231_08530 [Candidatus Firestonebacteria bacterium RIFOXYA2_FULL_40_8]
MLQVYYGEKVKKILLAVIIAVLVPGLAFAESYKNNLIVRDVLESGFKAEIPDGWAVKFSNDLKLNINGEKKEGKNINKATIKVGFDLLKGKKDIPAGYIENIKKSYISMMDAKLAKEGVKQSEGNVGKIKGVKLEYKLNIGTSVYMFWQFISRIDGENLVIITCTSPEAHFKSFEADFKAIVDTMEFEIPPK